MKIINLNPDTAIGASAWFVEMEGHRLLMDAGTHPRLEGRGGLPLYDSVKNEEVDAIAISHCHHDHVGSLPVALRYFPQAHVLMTELSYFLVERVLHNSVNVMKRQRDELGLKEYPLYSHDEVDELFSRFQGFKYNREVDWASFHKTRAGFLSPTLEFYDAGHTLGSAGIMVRGKKNSSFSIPANPDRRLRLMTITERALSTSRIGMPKIGLCRSWRAAGFTVSFAPITRTTSARSNSGLISSMSASRS